MRRIETPFRCTDHGYRHSDEVIELTTQTSLFGLPARTVVCSCCGKPVEHVTINEKED